MLDHKHLNAIKISAQREEWSAVGYSLVALTAQAGGDPVDTIRIKGLASIIQERNLEDLSWAVDALLRIKGRDSH